MARMKRSGLIKKIERLLKGANVMSIGSGDLRVYFDKKTKEYIGLNKLPYETLITIHADAKVMYRERLGLSGH